MTFLIELGPRKTLFPSKRKSVKMHILFAYINYFSYLCGRYVFVYKQSTISITPKICMIMKKFFLSLVAIFAAISMFGQDQLNIYFVDEAGEQVRKTEATLGEPFNAPHLVFEPAEAERYVRVQYESKNPDVAEIDMTSGRITLKGEGSTSITAVTGQTEQYASASARYNLEVVAPHDTTPVEPPTCPEARFYQNGAEVKTLNVKVGEAVSVPMLMSATGEFLSGRVVIDSTNIARVTEDNLVYGLQEGSTMLYVLVYKSSGAAGSGEVLTCEYGLPIIVEAGKPQKQSPELSWSDTVVYAELGVPVEAPVLRNPHNVPMNKIESQNPKVAEISEDGKVLTIRGVGTAEIFAESFDTDEYYAQSVSYFVHVHTLGLRVKGINVTSANAHDVLGDSSRCVTFEVESRTLHLNSWNTDTPLADAMIADEGEEIPLTIMLHGQNAISNAAVGIWSQTSPVVIIGNSQRDVLTINTYEVGVMAPYFKIHQCAVSADAPYAGLKLGSELGVSVNSHLMATSNGVAIEVPQLILAEGEEGVAILTPGVRFEQKKGFLTEKNQPAKEVEIGKVPVVVPSDEVTTIDFTQTDPEGNESVVFSASANDSFNEETGQLEISTSLTDAQVEEALENLVPGSSAWIDLLPGSLVFDIPAGEGELRVQCMTLPGYKLQVKVDGVAAVSVTMESLGWAKVSYNVATPTHVVIYLHAEGGASAPARIIARTADEPAAGAFIQALVIAPKDAPQGIENIDVNSLENGSKMLINGNLYIIREGRIFNANGAQVK